MTYQAHQAISVGPGVWMLLQVFTEDLNQVRSGRWHITAYTKHLPDPKPNDAYLHGSSSTSMVKDGNKSNQKEQGLGDSCEKRKTIVAFSDGDLENPYNWSAGKKIFVLIAGIIAVINSTLGSSLPSGAIDYMSIYFHVTNEQQLVLPISLFLVGYVFGPVVFGSLSETYGRRIIMLGSFIVFTLFTMACALAPNWPAFLVFRLICGFMASSAIAVVGGLYADIFADPVIRGRAMAVFMAVSPKSFPSTIH